MKKIFLKIVIGVVLVCILFENCKCKLDTCTVEIS